MTKNEHTGKTLITNPQTKQYAEGWERIFGKRPLGLVENHLPCNETPAVRFSQGAPKE